MVPIVTALQACHKHDVVTRPSIRKLWKVGMVTNGLGAGAGADSMSICDPLVPFKPLSILDRWKDACGGSVNKTNVLQNVSFTNIVYFLHTIFLNLISKLRLSLPPNWSGEITSGWKLSSSRVAGVNRTRLTQRRQTCKKHIQYEYNIWLVVYWYSLGLRGSCDVVPVCSSDTLGVDRHSFSSFTFVSYIAIRPICIDILIYITTTY